MFLMQTFKQFISERYINAVEGQPKAEAIKNEYKDEVWAILQRSYKAIGGIKGSGFASPEDMVEKIPMWKLARKNGNIVAVVLYKDKGGRKVVATGTDGSPAGKEAIIDMLKNELKRSYGEKSKASLGLAMKTFDWPTIEPFLLTPKEAERVLGKDVTPIKKVSPSEYPEDAKLTLKKYPQLIDYGYLREIGGSMVFKVMIGTPGMSIR